MYKYLQISLSTIAAICIGIFSITTYSTAAQPKLTPWFTETQVVLTDKVWIPQSGVHSSAYFNRFDTQNGKRVLRGIQFSVENYLEFYHGIEVLDDEFYRWNIFGQDPVRSCDCEQPVVCNGKPYGSWIKSHFKLLLGDQEHSVGAINKDLGVSVIGAPGPFDGSNDQTGYSGNFRITNHYSAFDVQRTSDPKILAEFTGTGYESTHMFYTYGGVSRLDCPIDGAESFNVDSSYDHFAESKVTCLYYWTYK
jgi:hypothetical protein